MTWPVTGTGICLGVLPGCGEGVLRRAGDRPGQDLQHARAGLHVDRRARRHRTDGLAADGTFAVEDLAKVDNRQQRAALRERGVEYPLVERCRACPGLRELEPVSRG